MDKESCGGDNSTQCTRQNSLDGVSSSKIDFSNEMIKPRDSLVHFHGDSAEKVSSLTKPGASKGDILHYPNEETSMIDSSSSSYEDFAEEIILDGDSVKVLDKGFCEKLTTEPECISLENSSIVNTDEKEVSSNESLLPTSVDFMDIDSSASSVGDFMAEKTAESPNINSETRTTDLSTGSTVTAKVSSEPSNAVSPTANSSILPVVRTSNSPSSKNPVSCVIETSVTSQDKSLSSPASPVPAALLSTDEKEKSSSYSLPPTSVNFMDANSSSTRVGAFTVEKKADNPFSTETRTYETSNVPIVTEKTVSCEASTSVSPTDNISVSPVARTSDSESTKNLVSPVIRTSVSSVVGTSASLASSVPPAVTNDRTGINRKFNRDDTENEISAKKRRKPVGISAPSTNRISCRNMDVYNGCQIFSNNAFICSSSVNRYDHASSDRQDSSFSSERCKSFYYNQGLTFTNRRDMSFHYCQNLTLSNCRNLLLKYCQSVSLSNCQNISVQYCQNVTLKDCSDVTARYCQRISFSKCMNYSYPYCQGVSFLD